VSRLGAWIAARRRSPMPKQAVPLGIHLEGPYLQPGACGAHPPRALRKPSLAELEELWLASHQQLRILTLAPELLGERARGKLCVWAQERGITLSLGHSHATEEQAKRAFDQGFSGVTHAWNALAFHHRSPGALGAALGRRGIHVELILDRIHVAPAVARWTRALHGSGVCYVSDCVPAAKSRGWHRFGPLRVQSRNGACRLKDGRLAGGAQLLPEAFCSWVEREARQNDLSPTKLLRRELDSLTLSPLRAIGQSPKGLPQVVWSVHRSGRVGCHSC
jgi:N-acetylglucosamine-6-phosphate deacetylase